VIIASYLQQRGCQQELERHFTSHEGRMWDERWRRA
jgi:hypothetical protein